MTLAELAALPISSGPLFQKEDTIMLIEDEHGHFWTTGWSGGILYKRRMR